MTPRGHVVAPIQRLDADKDRTAAKFQMRHAISALTIVPVRGDGNHTFPHIRFPPSFLRVQGTEIGHIDDKIAKRKMEIQDQLYTPPRRSPRLPDLTEKQKISVKANRIEFLKQIQNTLSPVSGGNVDERYNCDNGFALPYPRATKIGSKTLANFKIGSKT